MSWSLIRVKGLTGLLWKASLYIKLHSAFFQIIFSLVFVYCPSKVDIGIGIVFSSFSVFFQAPWSLTFWLVYERIRNVAGVSGF